MQTTALMNALDIDRIRAAVEEMGTPTAHVGRMLDRLGKAMPVRPVAVPPDLVTMNSIVRVVDLDTGEMDLYALRYKVTRASDASEATAISVHDLLGSELLGRRVGETVEFQGRRGTVRLRIAALDYQPERSGKFSL